MYSRQPVLRKELQKKMYGRPPRNRGLLRNISDILTTIIRSATVRHALSLPSQNQKKLLLNGFPIFLKQENMLYI